MDLERKFEVAAVGNGATGGAAPATNARVVRPRVSFQINYSNVIVAALIAVASATGFAQQPPRPDAGSVLESSKPAPSTPRLAPDVLPRAAEPRPALGAPGLKVTVTRFRISGNTLFGEDVLVAAIREFVGKEQNIDGLNDAATKVRAYYRERGYFLAPFRI